MTRYLLIAILIANLGLPGLHGAMARAQDGPILFGADGDAEPPTPPAISEPSSEPRARRFGSDRPQVIRDRRVENRPNDRSSSQDPQVDPFGGSNSGTNGQQRQTGAGQDIRSANPTSKTPRIDPRQYLRQRSLPNGQSKATPDARGAQPGGTSGGQVRTAPANQQPWTRPQGPVTRGQLPATQSQPGTSQPGTSQSRGLPSQRRWEPVPSGLRYQPSATAPMPNSARQGVNRQAQPQPAAQRDAYGRPVTKPAPGTNARARQSAPPQDHSLWSDSAYVPPKARTSQKPRPSNQSPSPRAAQGGTRPAQLGNTQQR